MISIPYNVKWARAVIVAAVVFQFGVSAEPETATQPSSSDQPFVVFPGSGEIRLKACYRVERGVLIVTQPNDEAQTAKMELVTEDITAELFDREVSAYSSLFESSGVRSEEDIQSVMKSLGQLLSLRKTDENKYVMWAPLKFSAARIIFEEGSTDIKWIKTTGEIPPYNPAEASNSSKPTPKGNGSSSN